METPRGGIFGRLGEKVLGWIALGLLIAAGIAIYQLDATTKTALWQGLWRSIFWVAGVAALPWVARLFIRRILEIGSNWGGVALIGGFVVVDLLFGLVMMSGCHATTLQVATEAAALQSASAPADEGFLPDSGWGWLAALAALAVAGTYNYLVTEYLAEQAGG